MSFFATLFSAFVLAQIVRTCIPYVLGAMGGILTERSGVIQIGIEGLMLLGGLACVVAELATGSPWVGLLAALAMGAFVGLVHGALVAVFRVDGVISGLAINLFALGGTRVALRTLYRSTSNSPSITGFRWFEGNDGVHSILRAVVHPTTILAIALLLLVPWLLARTTRGLAIRAAGDEPVAARSLGVDVPKARLVAATIGGALAALGGASLAQDMHQFQSGMTNGRGFLAIAIVILSGWNFRRAAVFSICFAILDACQIVFQGAGRVVGDALTMLPFIVALASLAFSMFGSRKKLEPPKGLGRFET